MALLDRSDVDFVDDENSAARLYLELREQQANPGLRPGQVTETKAAINKLLRVWPEADDLAAELSDDDLGGLSPALKRRRDSHRKAKGVTAQDARKRRETRRKAAPAAKAPT
ncbi:MAG TPA: hypothetical protein VFR97_04960, partial [Capillimicrobium sp.]|nr:hypothetical protein [Capillimicrobium sp.]